MEGYENARTINPITIPPGMVKKIVIGIVVLIFIAVGTSMVYTIQEQEHAAIITFGKLTEEKVEAGLHFKAP